MAWPNTPLTTYVNNTTPAVDGDDLNALQATTNARWATTRSIWTGPQFMSSASWTFTATTADATSASDILAIGCPLWFTDATHYAQVTRVDVRVNQGSSTGVGVALTKVTNMSTTSAPASTTIASTTGPSASGHGTAALTGLTGGNKPDEILIVLVTAAHADDVVYGVRWYFDYSLFPSTI